MQTKAPIKIFLAMLLLTGAAGISAARAVEIEGVKIDDKVTLASGVPELDQAVQRIVEGLAPYPAFPSALAREFDVVEIRRTWHFDMAVRLY